jgi:Leucine-rich repeat (LRR) protein
MRSLRALDLGNNNLTTLPAGVFSVLSALSDLDLAGNRLSVQPPAVYKRWLATRIAAEPAFAAVIFSERYQASGLWTLLPYNPLTVPKMTPLFWCNACFHLQGLEKWCSKLTS